jgi:hypothetical protein
MDRVSQKNTLDNQWSYSPNLDPDGNEIIEASEAGYIYNYKGPNKEISLVPLYNSSVDTFKTVIILLVTTLATLNVYQTFGCKSQYLQYTRPYQYQLALFLAIFINIFIVSVQNSSDSENNIFTSTPALFIYSLFALIIINMVARIGNSWAVFRTPFWPGPFSWWGIIMLSAILIFIFDINRIYWRDLNKNTYGSSEKENEKFYENIELATLFITTIAFIGRFIIEIFKKKSELKDKFNFINFLFGIEDPNKIINNKTLSRRGHFCKESVFKQFDKEVKVGRKKALWTKILNILSKGKDLF